MRKGKGEAFIKKEEKGGSLKPRSYGLVPRIAKATIAFE